MVIRFQTIFKIMLYAHGLVIQWHVDTSVVKQLIIHSTRKVHGGLIDRTVEMRTEQWKSSTQIVLGDRSTSCQASARATILVILSRVSG